jgi:predicted RNase H-like nuclease
MPQFPAMREVPGETWLAGVDGCRAGWIAAFVQSDGSEARVEIFTRFADVLACGARVIAVDMPIGLPRRSEERAAERLVRPLIGARQSSVFSVPSRKAVHAADYREACRVAAATSDPPRKVSRQLFHLAPKIREIDECLRADAKRAEEVYEVHPEVAFWRLNGNRALGEPKKIKGRLHPAGVALRQRILLMAGLSKPIVEGAVPRGAAQDDLLDALACAAIARRIYRGEAEPFPDPPPRDDHNLRMAIWA